jgi:hypothetical protein
VARIRSVKPEFFQHEALFEAETASKLPLRLCFAGLWTQCDREGRFEWRPRQLKLNILPYDDVDFSAVLSALESSGFVKRYDVEGKSYGFIPSWLKHQHINVREPSSTIPAPDGYVPDTGPVPDENGTGTVPIRKEGKGKEGKTCAQARETFGLNLEAWDRWLAYRVEKRKPLGEMSQIAAAKELAAYGKDQLAVVDQSIVNGWQGLFDLKAGAKRAGETKWY